MGTHGADGASGATDYQRIERSLVVVGCVLEKGKRVGEGGDETRLAREESQGKGPDACL
jgi:hypothetical protein